MITQPPAKNLPPTPRGNAFVRFLQFIRFSHTVFALPFALGALLVAADGRPTLRTALLVLVCMVFARTAAMLFNRVADWSIDQRNPRTAARHRFIDRTAAIAALIACSAGFVVAASMINRLTALLSPVALAIIFFYSLTKRFTDLTHFVLGAALAVAPAGAWIAQTGRLDLPPLVLGAGVICWVAGFDLIYATQDFEFDRSEGLRSLVVRLGIPSSLMLAQVLHLLMFIALIAFGVLAHLHLAYCAAMVLIVAALVYEHRAARRLDLAAINRAFFQSNAFVSAVFLVAIVIDRCF
ncbi:MAG: putative 4-hydroxybenzoate polyprenyltransferase [Verrucomicrobiota bacterium]|nr:putative 4-hydroxybenzoate polyprenyltransferase [Verrucomicrobiota bacterium]